MFPERDHIHYKRCMPILGHPASVLFTAIAALAWWGVL